MGFEVKKDIPRYHPPHGDGLFGAQVEARKNAGLINAAQKSAAKSNAAIFKDNVLTLFNLFNLLIAVALAAVRAWTNLFFMLIILINIGIGIVQEVRGRRLVNKLTLITAQQIKVVREGRETEIAVNEIVLDDVMLLEAGGQICADSTVLFGEIEVDESLLTGESDPVIKTAGAELLSGSFVISGKAWAKAERVGADNFAARVAREAKKHKKVKSELLDSMRTVTKFTGFCILPIGIILFLQAFFLRQEGFDGSVIASAAALLGMLPKGLVLLISIALATGVIKLAKKKVLVQQPYAIETLARADVLCLDKTGTITEGKMRVTDAVYENASVLPYEPQRLLQRFAAAALDNNATSEALKQYFLEKAAAEAVTALSQTPFSSARKFSAVTFSEGTVLVGAPERLAEKHIGVLPEKFSRAEASGKRVLFAAFSAQPVSDGTLPPLTVFAAIELSDPVRKNAPAALQYFKDEGVAVKIISGDNPLTVSHAAREAGLSAYESYIDMTGIEGGALTQAAATYSIFGRVSPEQKKQLVLAFKAQKHTVAFAGDGVNDVLALKEADCGIAPASGSAAARQVAQLVLTNSDFTALPDVVAEGRRVVNNVTRVSGIFFIKTIYSVLLSVLFMILNQPFPFLPIQITLIDLAIEGYPALFMSFERDTKRIKTSFLNASIMNALPFGLVILVCVSALSIVGWLSAVPAAQITALMYLAVGFISLAALFKACLRFNKLRIFLFITSALGFFFAVWFLTDILPLLHLTLPEPKYLWIAAVTAAASIPLIFLLTRFIKPSDKLKNLTDKEKL
ncbi:MAG: cation-translocating P-type ATPase [Firmicutes bacterium]|nr:cation-translocating P-type ATPase [Bacillota bacterium]